MVTGREVEAAGCPAAEDCFSRVHAAASSATSTHAIVADRVTEHLSTC
jgi:hypothetical protein